MATISVGSKSYMRPAGRGSVRMITLKEEASQTFKRGAILVQDATNKNEAEEAGSDPTARILGLACQDASGTADTDTPIWMAEPGVEFIGHIEDAATLAVGNLGTDYGVVYDSTNAIWRVDTSETTNKCVTVTGFFDAVGDVNGRVYFQFLAAARGIFKG